MLEEKEQGIPHKGGRIHFTVEKEIGGPTAQLGVWDAWSPCAGRVESRLLMTLRKCDHTSWNPSPWAGIGDQSMYTICWNLSNTENDKMCSPSMRSAIQQRGVPLQDGMPATRGSRCDFNRGIVFSLHAFFDLWHLNYPRLQNWLSLASHISWSPHPAQMHVFVLPAWFRKTSVVLVFPCTFYEVYVPKI